MTVERQRNLLEIVGRALECEGTDRKEVLRIQCGEDVVLRDEVEKLLAAAALADADGFLAESNPLIGTNIGPYRIQRCLGEGGMGAVYLVEQKEPIRRSAALKIIKLGMDTRQVMARFASEREALSQMNHPNVSQVLDAGAAITGRPYFVMEFVEGTLITTYCDEHRLSIHERLKLFLDVCAGVQHAHQKGIIHRDIKPSNVLIAEIDEKPVPKVIDFGIAKATQQQGAPEAYFTEAGQLIGTPEYMSPEQVERGFTDIDTRSDVYSLGVLLYELLVGARPFDDSTFRQVGFGEIQRIIREVDPPKPSLRLGSVGALSTPIASNRGTQIRALARELRGELDWIVMKCLEKDRSRRYQTVNDLVVEIQHFLNHEPVMAGPPSAAYRMRKFVRRNRVSVAAVAGIIAVLGVGMVVSDLQRRRAVRAETLAQIQLNDTQLARDEAEEVMRFLTDTLEAVDPSRQGKDTTLREVLDQSAETIATRFADKPLIEARLRRTFASTYLGLGLYTKAEAHAAAAATLYRRVNGERHPTTLAAMNTLAAILGAEGNLNASEVHHRATFEVQRRLLGEEHPDTLKSMNNLAATLYSQGHYAQAEKVLRNALVILRRVQGEEHPTTLASIANLANALDEQGKYAEGEELHREAFLIRQRVLGEEHPDTLGSMNDLAASLYSQGRYARAEELYRQALDTRLRVLGEEHPDTLVSMNNLGAALKSQGRYEQAEEQYRRTFMIQRRVLGVEHPHTLASMSNLAGSMDSQGQYSQSEELYRNVLRIRRDVLGDEHPQTLGSMNGLAISLRRQGRYAEAENLFLKVLDIRVRVLGEEHPDTLISKNNLANLLHSQGNYTKAEALFRDVLNARERILGEEHPDTLVSMNNLAVALNSLGLYVEAEVLYQKTLTLQRRVLGEEHPETLNGIATLLEKIQRYRDAEPYCRKAESILAMHLPADHRDRRTNANLLGAILCGLRRFSEAEPLLIQSYEGLRDDSGVRLEEKKEMLNRLVYLYEAWDATESGKGHAEKAAQWRANLVTLPQDLGDLSTEP